MKDPRMTKPSFLDSMLDISEKHEEFNDECVIHELCTLMLAGQDSVSGTIAFCLYMLTIHEDIQERVVEELRNIFQDTDRVPTSQDVRSMTYLNQVLKETMRLFPTVPIIGRKTGEDIPMGKITMPAGSTVLMSPFSLHRTPHFWPDPEKFDPDRFLPENVETRHPYAYSPFSAGPRNCIGEKFAMMEMKTVLATVLRNFRLSSSRARVGAQL